MRIGLIRTKNQVMKYIEEQQKVELSGELKRIFEALPIQPMTAAGEGPVRPVEPVSADTESVSSRYTKVSADEKG